MYIIIAGGGQVGSKLARQMTQQKNDVIVIEQDSARCDKIYARTGAVVINGSITSLSVLREAGIEKADVCVAATNRDAENLAFSLLCKSFEVPRIIARLRNPDYEKSYRIAGVDSVVQVTNILVDQILTEIQDDLIKKITSIAKGKAHIYKLDLPERSALHNKTVAEITKKENFPKNIIFVAVGEIEDNKFFIPHGDSVIKSGQELVFLSTDENIESALEILTEEFPERRNKPR
ncbi:MAG: potassium channel family protein [Fidelibacterota bacterium]